MATLAETMEADLEAQISELPTSYTFDSVTASGSFTDLTRQKGMELDGYMAGKTGRLTIILSDHASPPVENDSRLVTVNSVDYRVSQREDSPNGVEATLTLTKQN